MPDEPRHWGNPWSMGAAPCELSSGAGHDRIDNMGSREKETAGTLHRMMMWVAVPVLMMWAVPAAAQVSAPAPPGTAPPTPTSPGQVQPAAPQLPTSPTSPAAPGGGAGILQITPTIGSTQSSGARSSFGTVGRGLPGMPGGPPLTGPVGAQDPSRQYMSPPVIGPLFCDPSINIPC